MVGTLGYALQNAVDVHHAKTLQGHSERINELNHQLRNVLDHINTKCKRLQTDPDIQPPYNLSETEEAFNQLRELYTQYKLAHLENVPEDAEELQALTEGLIGEVFPGDLEDVSEAELKTILDIIEQMQKSNKDEVQEITQNLYLLGQLFITITDIIRKMDETYRRFLERIAEKLGMR